MILSFLRDKSQLPPSQVNWIKGAPKGYTLRRLLSLVKVDYLTVS
jgi:hypothetical protein